MRRNLSKLGSPVVIAVVLAVAHGFAGGQTAATVDLTGSWRLDPKLHDTLWEGRPLTEKRLYVSYAQPT